MGNQWLAVDDIASCLCIKWYTFYKRVSKKHMPAHRLSRLWKFRKEEVDEWVKSGGADDHRHADSGRAGNR